jgi:hypothetical protein
MPNNPAPNIGQREGALISTTGGFLSNEMYSLFSASYLE